MFIGDIVSDRMKNSQDSKNNKKIFVSLRTKAFRVIFISSLTLMLAGIAAGLLLHSYTTLRHYKIEAKHLIDTMLALQDGSYIEKIFRKTRQIYESLPEDVRENQMSVEFDSAFRPLVDGDFFAARDILVKFREETKQRNMFLMFLDKEHGAVVYVVDGDEDEWAYLPGQWTEADIAATEAIADSPWRLAITHQDEYGWIGSDTEPIYAKNGEMIGYAVADMDLNGFLKNVLGFLIILVPVAAAIVVMFAFLFSELLKKHIILHLVSMAAASRDYAQMDKVQLEEETSSVFEPLGIKTADEMEDLWKSMTIMETDVKESMIRLREVTAVKERMDAELAIATSIQKGLLPDKFPESTEYDLYASMEPAKEVGGDLYDFFMIDDTHLALVIADVSGKGISAALFMVVAKTLIRNLTEQEAHDPAQIFTLVNRKLIEVNRACLFVTAWLGILDLKTGQVVYVDAGHEYPAIRRAGGRFSLFPDKHCVPLAASRKAVFRSDEFMLGPGDTLFVYTDGVPEANNEAGELMGTDRMLEILNRIPDASPQDVISNVKEGMAEYVKAAEQFDDTTMLCIRFNKTE